MAQGRSRRGDLAARIGARNRHRRGFVSVKLPRYVIPKPLASGKTAFYYNVPTKYRKLGCNIQNEPLGTDYAKACGEGGRAETLNGLFDEWNDARRGLPIPSEEAPRIGTIDVPRVQGEPRLPGEGQASIAPELRMEYARDLQHVDTSWRSCRRPADQVCDAARCR
jgi:hypothetical protein